MRSHWSESSQSDAVAKHLAHDQNPWKETTPRDLRKWDIPLIRRRSGGGTVFHDMGNTNFSIILPRILFTRDHGAELVAKAVRGLGVEGCTVNSRNDVIVKDGVKELKISPFLIE
jgi:lipoate-protein ligase A